MRMLRATPDHARIVGGLLYDFNTEFDAPTPSAEELAARFAQLLDRDDVLVLLAETFDHPAGFAFLTFRPTPYCAGPLAQLEELYIRPNLRDRGIGTELLQQSVRDAQERGCCEMHINVDAVDVSTRRFYERYGFTNIAPGEDYRMLCYIRNLND